MNKDQIQGKFTQLKGKLKETWGRLSDDDVALYNGNQEQFFGKLQESYGLSKEEAQKKIRQLEESCECSHGSRAA